MITPHLHPPHCPAYTPARWIGFRTCFSHPRTRGGPHTALSGHVRFTSNPTHHARLLLSALPPRCVPRSTAILPSRVLAPLPARTKCVLRGTVAPAPSCRGHSTSYRSLRERRVDCVQTGEGGDGGAAQHTQRWQYTPYTCRTACAAFDQVCPVVRTESLMGERPAATLNAAFRCTAPTMTVSHTSSSIRSSQSHRSSSQLPHSL